GQEEGEAAARAGPGLHPDPPAVALDDRPADGEPHPVAVSPVVVPRPGELLEDPLPVFRQYAGPFVGHRDLGAAADDAPRERDSRGLTGTSRLHGIRDEVLENPAELRRVTVDDGEVPDDDHGPGGVDLGLQALDGALCDL